MKKIFILIFLLLIAGCTEPVVELEEITGDSIFTEVPPLIQEIEQDTAPYYNFSEGDTKEILGREIKVTNIAKGPSVDLIIDGKEESLIETKNEELIDNLKVMIYFVKDEYNSTDYVTLKIEEFYLYNNEYILKKGEKVNIYDKDVILEESRYDNSIFISVYDEGTKIGYTEKIKKGETISLYGVDVTNIKNYYKINQYALINIE